MGFDSFGINAENFALTVGEHPRELTARTKVNFRRQLTEIGGAWDWSRVIDTSDPAYYRWTQWLLVQLFGAGLMYQADAPVLWCPSCLTVLAREQTEDDGTRCERCASVVVERVMRQWFLRITAYAERLLSGLDHLDWPERSKRLQRAWIGKRAGVEIGFGDLVVFTTRPEALPAATFLAVPPGHPAAGTTRPHPLTGDAVPVVEGDYVLADYGTGAVMGVPAHDVRDAQLAAERRLPVSHAPLLGPGEARALGTPAARYRLRDWLVSRQRYWGPPIPIVHCQACGPVAVPEEQLPVELPHLADFRPTGAGGSPLATARHWVEVACPSCGGAGERETDVSDTFVDSSWYFLRYPCTEFDDRPFDRARVAKVLPVDFYAGGPEHVQRHHLYARFVTMALHDLGFIDFDEPFPRIRLGGIIVHQGAKMSKSRGNVVTPDDYVTRHGADVLRCALLFSAAWEEGGDFQLDAVAGITRFFARVWRLIENRVGAGPAPAVVARAVRDVTTAVERMRFNVALARLMELTPLARSHEAQSVLVRLLAPLAPHLAEELWARLGGSSSVHEEAWPDYDELLIGGDLVDFVVQVDGTRRGVARLARGATEEEVLLAARALAPVRSALAGRRVTRVVFVAGRLINLVTRPSPQPQESAVRRSDPGLG
jgi:leucyl-tRNA synthetase